MTSIAGEATPSPSEQQLVGKAKAGDREAFLKLITPYYERVYATAVRLLGNSDDADEVTQEAVLRTFWKIQTFHGQAHFYTWLYRTALNLCYRRLSDTQAKIASAAVRLDETAETEEGLSRQPSLTGRELSPREDLERREEVALVRRALASLDERDFQILVLREFEELPYELISQRLKLSKGTVMSRLHRARIALAKRLKELGVG